MEQIKPFLRWLAVAAAMCAIAFAYLSPRRADSVAAAGDSPPPVAAPTVSPPATAQDATPSLIAVYACGAVKKPAVYRMVAGSRVIDVVTKAGGLSRDADPEAINLAEPLVDGMKVDVPKKGE